MIMLFYDIKFRIMFNMIRPTPCVLFSPICYLVWRQKTKERLQTLKFHNGTPNSITDIAKYYYTFCFEKIVVRIKSLLVLFPSLEKGFCINWSFFNVSCKTRNHPQTSQSTHKPPTNHLQTSQIPKKLPTNQPKIASLFLWRHFL